MGTGTDENQNGESSVDLVSTYVQHPEGDAAEKIYYRHRAEMLRQARAGISQQLQPRIDAEDVYQSVSVILFEGLRTGRFRIERAGDLQALIRRLIERRILKKVEIHGAQKRSSGRETPLDAAPPAASAVNPPDVQAEQSDVLEQLLSKLPNPRHRDVLCLALGGQEVASIAAATHYSQARVRQILENAAVMVRREHAADDL